MIGEILEISNNNIIVKNNNNLTGIANLYVKIYDDKSLFVAEDVAEGDLHGEGEL